MKGWITLAAASLSIALLLPAAALAKVGGIGLSATRVIYPLGAPQTTLTVTNTSPRVRYLINAWVDDSHDKKDENFIITPPLYVSEPSSESALRIIYSGPDLPADRESLFYVNVKSIPAIDKKGLENKNVLQLAILSRIKLFVRPKNLPLAVEDADSKLAVTRSGGGINIVNPTPYYITLVNLFAGNQKQPSTMVAPMSSTLIHTAANSITFQTINDYGALAAAKTLSVK